MRVLIDFPATPTRLPARLPIRLQHAFHQPRQVLVAHQPNEVKALLTAVEAAARAGQWCVGYVAYEAAAAFDTALETQPPNNLPLAWFAVFDQTEEYPEAASAVYQTTSWHDQTNSAQFAANFAQIKNAIAQGDAYQINYTTRLHSALSGDPLAYFQALQRGQPNGYSLFIDTPDWQICSVSPELFFDWDGHTLTTEPMKGTAARGLDAASDEHLAKTLRQSSKEQAENLMIVDLLRNDLGRIAQTGTVKVPALFELHALPTAWQMTSTITAQTRPQTQLVDIFTALFPCGSVTGAPKVKAMQIIRALEPTPRGVYCGALGIVRPHSNGANIQATFNVGIRTVVLQNGQAECGIGSGITWDANCQAEQNEFATKQRFLTRATQPFALLETLKLENGSYWLLSEHLSRLQRSAAHFAYPFNLAEVEQSLSQAIENHPLGAWRVRLLLDAQGQASTKCFALEAKTPTMIRIELARQAIHRGNEFLYYKTTERTVYEPFSPTTPQVFDTLLWNEQGELTEFTKGNLVVQFNGQRYTPPVSCGLLAGCLREQLLARDEITERVILKTELAQAEKIWFINSVRGWLEVVL